MDDIITVSKEQLLKFAKDYVETGEGWLVKLGEDWKVVSRDKIWVERLYDPRISKSKDLYYIDSKEPEWKEWRGGRKPLDAEDVINIRYVEDNYQLRGKPLSESNRLYQSRDRLIG